MTDFSGFVLEDSVERGWDRFLDWLSDVVANMSDDDVIVVSCEADTRDDAQTRQPFVQFCAVGDELIRAEASGNRHLDPPHRLSEPQIAELAEIGYRLPSSPARALATSGSTNFSVDRTRADANEIATMSVRALREVFGVLHPAFLTFRGDARPPFGEGPTPSLEPSPRGLFALSPEGLPASGTLASQWALAESGPIAIAESSAHLRQLIENALVPILGRRPLVDEDGDFAIPCSGSLVFVRVVESAPLIAVFSQLARGVSDTDAACREIAELNAAVEMVKFFLVDDRIVAGCTLPAKPFVGEHLREVLTVVGKVASDFQRSLSLVVNTDFPA
jgi:hypothetical protein